MTRYLPKNHSGLAFWLSNKIRNLMPTALEDFVVSEPKEEDVNRRRRIYDICMNEVEALVLLLPDDTFVTHEGLMAVREIIEAYQACNGPLAPTMMVLDKYVRWTQGGAVLDAITGYAKECQKIDAVQREYKILGILPISRSTTPEGDPMYALYAGWIEPGSPIWWTGAERIFKAILPEAIQEADALAISNDLFMAYTSLTVSSDLRVLNGPSQKEGVVLDIATVLEDKLQDNDIAVVIVGDDVSEHFIEITTKIIEQVKGDPKLPTYEYEPNDRAENRIDTRPFTENPYGQSSIPRYPFRPATRNILHPY